MNKYQVTIVPKKGKFRKVVIEAIGFAEATEKSEKMRKQGENSFVTKQLE